MQNALVIIAGAILAVGFVLIARKSGNYRKEKKIYSLGLIVAALIYVGFGIFSGSAWWNLTELGGVLIYASFAVLGLRRSGWFLSAGWALHVLWDAVLHGEQAADFVPYWYQMLCIGFDLLLAGYIGFRQRMEAAE
ncbi:MAG: hypothetical protein M3384_21080 [Acidobacteriota bacterium]|nr:hypothetical protein [Acidobacteriota bacterium]